MARLQLDNLLFSLTAVETARKPASDAASGDQDFARQLRKAADESKPTPTPPENKTVHADKTAKKNDSRPSEGSAANETARDDERRDPSTTDATNDAGAKAAADTTPTTGEKKKKPVDDKHEVESTGADNTQAAAAAAVAEVKAPPVKAVDKTPRDEHGEPVTAAEKPTKPAADAAATSKTGKAGQPADGEQAAQPIEAAVEGAAAKGATKATKESAKNNAQLQENSTPAKESVVDAKAQATANEPTVEQGRAVQPNADGHAPASAGALKSNRPTSDERPASEGRRESSKLSKRQSSEATPVANPAASAASDVAAATAVQAAQVATNAAVVVDAAAASIAAQTGAKPADAAAATNSAATLGDKGDQDAKGPLGSGATRAAGTGAQKSREPGQSSNLNQADRVRFVQRVSRAFQTMGAEGGQLRIRLSPAELGSLKLEVTLKDGVLSAKMETETAAARQAVLDNLPQLRDRLAEQGIKIERFDVDLMNQSGGGGFAGDQPQQQQSRSGAANRVAAAATAATTLAAETGPEPIVTNGNLNIVI